MIDNYIEKHGKRLYALCLKLCSNTWDSQDLWQDTWLKAYRAFSRYDETRNFENWLTKICVNTYKDMLRRKKLMSFFQIYDNESEYNLAENIPVPELDDYSDIRQAVDKLPDKYRIVVILFYYQGCSIEQTSQTLALPAGTVKSRLSKARSLLKGWLSDYE